VNHMTATSTWMWRQDVEYILDLVIVNCPAGRWNQLTELRTEKKETTRT
jgi:hypothetical protein